jgi:hypothetical protein
VAAAAEMVFELVDGVMIPRLSGEADGRRFFNLAQAARREKKSQRYMRTLHTQTFLPFLPVFDEGDPIKAGPGESAAAAPDVAMALLHRYKYPQLDAFEFQCLIEQCRQWGLSPWSRHVFTKWEWDYGEGSKVDGDGGEKENEGASSEDPRAGRSPRTGNACGS